MNQHAIDQRRQDARQLRDHDRAVASAIAIASFRDAVRETADRTIAERIAHARANGPANRIASWSLLFHGSHR